MFKGFWALFFLGIFPFLLMADVTPRIGHSERNETLEWDFIIRAGDTTQITSGSLDTLSLLGASDTLVTRYYANLGGSISMQIDARGGTAKYKIIVETIEKGSEAVSDSNFVERMWIHWEGNGDDSCYVTTQNDSIQLENRRSSSIFIPPLSIYAFRIRAVSLSTQSGNTRLLLPCTIWKE